MDVRAGISIEISVETVAGVRIAERAGADRIELCAGLADGGLTPSAALIEQAVAATTSTEVHVLIRPRPGDFRYSADEIALIRKDIVLARQCGADVSSDSLRVLDEAIAFGFTRVLTSGRRRSVLDGAPLIKEMVQRADGHIQVMACGGVRASNALQVVESTGVRDLHAAVRTPVGEVGTDDVSFAGVGVPAGFDRFETDADGVAALCSVIRG
jgi:copper homeostasis protein